MISHKSYEGGVPHWILYISTPTGTTGSDSCTVQELQDLGVVVLYSGSLSNFHSDRVRWLPTHFVHWRDGQ